MKSHSHRKLLVLSLSETTTPIIINVSFAVIQLSMGCLVSPMYILLWFIFNEICAFSQTPLGNHTYWVWRPEEMWRVTPRVGTTSDWCQVSLSKTFSFLHQSQPLWSPVVDLTQLDRHDGSVNLVCLCLSIPSMDPMEGAPDLELQPACPSLTKGVCAFPSISRGTLEMHVISV